MFGPIIKQLRTLTDGGILLLNKPKGPTSFDMVEVLRSVTKMRKIGHAGTLDPFATGVLVMLLGSYTTLQQHFTLHDKEYVATITLGTSTDTYDSYGQVVSTDHTKIPTSEELHDVIYSTSNRFQGVIMQLPPMYSAKKISGRRLYELARKGINDIDRKPSPVNVRTTLLNYSYPLVKIRVQCSKGTYIRCLGADLGIALGTVSHVSELTRVRSGPFHLEKCIDYQLLTQPGFQYKQCLIRSDELLSSYNLNVTQLASENEK